MHSVHFGDKEIEEVDLWFAQAGQLTALVLQWVLCLPSSLPPPHSSQPPTSRPLKLRSFWKDSLVPWLLYSHVPSDREQRFAVWARGPRSVGVHWWRIEDNHEHLRDGSQVVKFGGRCLHLLSHLTVPWHLDFPCSCSPLSKWSQLLSLRLEPKCHLSPEFSKCASSFPQNPVL